MTRPAPCREVPLEFAPAITGGQLVGFRVGLADRTGAVSRLFRLRLRYAVLPEGIYQRAVRDTDHPALLVDHPDVYWTSGDETFAERVQHYGRVPHRRTHAIRVPAELPVDSGRWLALLNDPLDYHWEEIRSLLLGALTTIACNQSAWNRGGVLRLDSLLSFVSRVFAAKWVLNSPGNTLEPFEGGFTFPKDPVWLEAVRRAAGGGDPFEFGADKLPWPTSFNPADYGDGPAMLFEGIQEEWMESAQGIARLVIARLRASPPTDQQEFIDRVIHMTGGYPLPYTPLNADKLARITGVEPARAMSWVWADQWTPFRLHEDLKKALPVARLRLESLIDVEHLRKIPDDWALDLVPTLRRFVRRLLEIEYGVDWQKKSVVNPERKKLMELRMDNDDEGIEWDYAEMPLLVNVVSREWGVFEPFLRHYSKSTGEPRISKKEFLDQLKRLNRGRNVVAHRRRRLRTEEKQLTIELIRKLADWQEALRPYQLLRRSSGPG